MKVVIPIETKVRELKGKLWLALNLVERGHNVIIGQVDDIVENLHRFPISIYFTNSAVFSQRRKRLLQKLNQSRCKICVLDTEGGIYKSEEAFLQRLSPEILEYVDIYFAWGKSPASVLLNSRGYPKEKVVISGNPRFDLIRNDLRKIYQKESEELLNKYGKLLLINTNFTRTNHFDGEEKQSEENKHQNRLFKSFIEMTYSLTNDFPEYKIILRPHPSENHQLYKNKFVDQDSVFVKHEGDVRSWIYAADGVIHNSCTTGIEAAIMQTPVFAYRPIKSENELQLPNTVSIVSESYNQLVGDINNYIGTEYNMDQGQLSELEKYIANTRTSATEKIVEELNGISAEKTDRIGEWRRIQIRVKRMMMENFGERNVESLLEALRISNYNYKRQKFPGLSEKELQDEINNFNDFINTHNIKTKRKGFSGDVFEIYQ